MHNARFRHRAVFDVLRPIVRLYTRLAYGFRGAIAPSPKAPALIFANHNCNLDPLFITTSFKMPIYFVASDAIFRLGWLSRLLYWLVAPIPIAKSQLDAKSIRAMLRIRGEGGTICMFPEGNRSFNGRTGYIAPAAAKLAQRLGLPLLLYRIEGAYLSTPRWGKGIRRGRVRGFVHSVISPQELKAMDLDELLAKIREALFVDAFAMQRAKPVKYRRIGGRALYLQRALYMCPKCREIGSMASNGHSFYCGACGFAVDYDEYGFFTVENGKPPFDDISAWDAWQKSQLRELIARRDFAGKYASTPLFSDEGCALYRAQGVPELIETGKLCAYSDRLELGSAIFLYEDILGIGVYLAQTLQFATKEAAFEIKCPKPMSASKYVNAFYNIKYAAGGEPDGFIGI